MSFVTISESDGIVDAEDAANAAIATTTRVRDYQRARNLARLPEQQLGLFLHGPHTRIGPELYG